MKTIKSFIQIAIAILFFNSSEAAEGVTIKLETIAENLVSPIGMACPQDGSGRMFIIEQRGLIYIIGKDKKLNATPFLDISKQVIKLTPKYDERGLLGIAFHPKYKENGRFFIYYSSSKKPDNNNDHIAILSEYKVDPSNPSKALPTEKIIFEIQQPEWNHNGGQLLFGSDGFLYIGLGDGGAGGDPHGTLGNGQNKSTLLGKILRLDVDSKSPYAIPTDNPFVGKAGRGEIWAYGLRNPWRFSIDKTTNRLFCGDVGQNKYEEINIIERGKNYGWRIMEGLHCFNPEQNCDKTELVMPITEYDRSEGSSVTGGFIYRGKLLKELYGKYIFGDWRGVLFALTEQPDKSWKREQVKIDFPDFKNLNISSFGEDQDGELYIMVQDNDGPFQLSGKVLQLK